MLDIPDSEATVLIPSHYNYEGATSLVREERVVLVAIIDGMYQSSLDYEGQFKPIMAVLYNDDNLIMLIVSM